MPLLSQLQNSYAQKSGKIEREHLGSSKPIERYWSLYHLNVEYLFLGVTAYLSEPIPNETDFKLFFNEMIKGGASAEVMLCAAAHTWNPKSDLVPESKYSDLLPKKMETFTEMIFKNWDINIHLALQFAVMEYVADMSKLGREKWSAAIMGLLQMGADPTYVSKEFYSIQYRYKHLWFSLLLEHIDTPYFCALAAKEPQVDYKILYALADQQKKLHPSFQFSEVQFHGLFSLISGLSRDTPGSLHKNEWFKFLEIYFPTQVSSAISNIRFTLYPKLTEREDYESIEHFRVRYGIDPIQWLVPMPSPQSNQNWMQSKRFQYLSQELHHEFINYLKSFYQTFMLPEAFWRCIPFYHYLRDQCQINAVPLGMMTLTSQEQGIVNLVKDPTFQQLEKDFPKEIKDWLYADSSWRFRIWEHISSSNDKQQFLHFAYHYNLDPFRQKKFPLSQDIKKSLAGFVRQQCELILKFIFQQSYPKAKIEHAKGSKKTDKIIYKDAEIIVSKNLAQIIHILKDILKDPEKNCDKYQNLVTVLAPKLAETKLLSYDQAEYDIYLGLTPTGNFYQESSSLGNFVNRKTNFKREVMPFVMGTIDPNSKLYKLSHSKIYDKRVLKNIFGFIGNYSLSKKIEPEKKEDSTSSLRL